MSFMLTTGAVLNQTKTVTRRVGWKTLQVGDRVQAVEKGQGLKKGEKMNKLAVIEIVSIQRERLEHIAYPRIYPDAKAELAREGFPDMTPDDFVLMFRESMNCPADQWVNRIEFRYVKHDNLVYVLGRNHPNIPMFVTADQERAEKWKAAKPHQTFWQVPLI